MTTIETNFQRKDALSNAHAEGHGVRSLKQLVDICKDIDVSMHTMYGNIIHNRWNAFDQNWARLQEQLNQYLSVAHSIRIRQKEAG